MSADWAFPPVPPALKALAPFFQRAQELRAKDPVMAYWCTYYAAKQGIASTRGQSSDARPFLYHVMTILEQMKAGLGTTDAASDDDAGAAYIENFALRVFAVADNEDRTGAATRSTARKFLAAANFLELLHMFDRPIGADLEEKIRYAKWKAADLAKAFREGRTPAPGDAHAPPPPPPGEPAPSLSAWSPDTSAVASPAGPAFAPLAASPVVAPAPLSPVGAPALLSPAPPAPSTPPAPGTPPAPSTPPAQRGAFAGQLRLQHVEGYATPGTWSTLATPGAEDAARAGESPSPSPSPRADDAWSTAGTGALSRQGSWTAPEGWPAGEPAAKRVHFSPSVVGGLSDAASDASPPPSPERFAPTLAPVEESPPVAELPVLPSAPAPVELPAPEATEPPAPPSAPQPQFPSAPPQFPSALPQFPSAPPQFPSAPPQFPSAPPHFPPPSPQFPAPPRLPSPPQVPSAPSPPPLLQARSVPSPPPQAYARPARVRAASPPAELTSTEIGRVQKHCKFAISALDYEDVDTARRELRAALAMLGG